MFQSTLPRGERLCFVELTSDEESFNPRSRVGSDGGALVPLTYQHVSIHAPAWGATYRNQNHHTKQKFQSTLPRGERHRRSIFPEGVYKFQSTLPRGERLFKPDVGTIVAHVSIHAPAWGATHTIGRNKNELKFQSTLPRGERHFCG